MILKMLLTVAAAAVFGFILLKLKVPGGMLIGAIVGVVVLNLLTAQAFFYPKLKVGAQILTGTYMGCMVTREDMKRLKGVYKPFLFVIGCFLCLNIAVAFILSAVSDYSLITCLLATAPGGMSDMPLVAMDMGADASAVAVMQFVRMLFGLAVLPSVVRATVHSEETAAEAPVSLGRGQEKGLKPCLRALAIGAVGGAIGYFAGIPAGALALSLAAVMIASAFAPFTVYMPRWLRRCAQVISGCCIGVSIEAEQLSQLPRLIVPLLILCAGYAACCLGMGTLMHRLFKIDRREAMLALSPAGASDMALIAADMGISSPSLVVIQAGRLIIVTMLFPTIFSLIISLVG